MTGSEPGRPYVVIVVPGYDPNELYANALRSIADALLITEADTERATADVWWSWGWEKVDRIEDLPHNVRCDGFAGYDGRELPTGEITDPATGNVLEVPVCPKCGWSAVAFTEDEEAGQ